MSLWLDEIDRLSEGDFWERLFDEGWDLFGQQGVLFLTFGSCLYSEPPLIDETPVEKARREAGLRYAIASGKILILPVDMLECFPVTYWQEKIVTGGE